MQGAAVYTWTGMVPGREAATQQLMADTNAYAEKCVADGRITDYAWYLSTQGDLNFFIVRGDMDRLMANLGDPELLALNTRSALASRDYRWSMYATGDAVPLLTELISSTATQFV